MVDSLNMKGQKAYCHKCRQETNQVHIFSEVEFDTREVFFESLKGESRWVVEQREWMLTKCLGCEMLNLEIEKIHVGNSNTSKSQIPGKSRRAIPTWIFALERDYIELLAEIYNAFNKELFRLSLMGIRTVIDTFIVENVGDIGSFKSKLRELENRRYITSSQSALLEAAVDAGSASAHRGYKPTEEVLNSVLDIVEHLLRTYPLEAKLKEITSATPKRK